MKKNLIIALCLILVGGLLFALAACTSNGGLKNTFVGKGVESVKTFNEDFENININTKTADITFLKAEDDVCKVVSYDNEKIRYDVYVEGGTLKITATDERKWFERISFFDESTLQVYLPESTYSALSIDESTGNISIPAYFSFENVNIELSTGNTDLYASVTGHIDIDGSTGSVYVKDVSCGSLSIDVSTGNVSLNNVECNSKVEIGVSTGRVQIDNVSLGSLKTEGDTGNFSAQNITSIGNISVKRDTGKVNIQGATVGGDLIAETDTGDISLGTVACAGDLNITVSTGKTNLGGVSCKNLITRGSTGWIDMVDVVASGSFNIERSTGDVTFTRCDASEITVLTDTGDVRGTLLSEKIFFYDTDTGDVDLPETMTGGKCKITTDTGDIVISIEK